MKGIALDIEQRSPAWYTARAGRLTGSRAADMLSRIKSGEAAGRRNLRVQLAVERLTNRPKEKSFRSAEMRAGAEKEPAGIAAYEGSTGNIVQHVGFVQHPDIYAGCSPDGLLPNDGLLEIKCPISTTHLEYLRGQRLPPEYRPQVTHNMWITGALWCDFVSYDESFPPAGQIFVRRVTRDELDIPSYEASAISFLSEVDNELRDVTDLLRGQYGKNKQDG